MSTEEGRLILGLQPTREAIRVHRGALHHVLVERGDNPRLAALVRFAQDQGATVERVPRAQLDRLARGTSHQGVACFAPQLVVHDPGWLWEQEEHDLVLALDGIQDPHNFGALIRSAVGLAQAPVLWPENASAPLTPATFRASAGAIEHACLVRVRSLHGSLSTAVEHGYQVVGLDASAPVTLQELPLRQKIVVVMGAEHEGLSRPVKRVCTDRARLTEGLHLDSLNVSVAAGIVLYEVLRQRAGA